MIKYDESIVDRYGIKLLDDRTVRKEAILTRDNYKTFQVLIRHLIKNPSSNIVPVYDFGVVEEPVPARDWYKYYYDMKRMAMLSQDEKNLIALSSDIHYGYPLDSQSFNRLPQLQKEFPALTDFLAEVFSLGRYTDIHSGNIMKDEEESYKLIDLESFIHTPLSHDKNKWFTGVS